MGKISKLFVICGHGAGDSGACGNSYTEAERVRALGRKIAEYGGNSVLLGDTDRNYYADNGISKLKLSNTEYGIIELHMDSSSHSSARGGHVIIKAGFNPDDYDRALANFISDIFPGRANTIVGRSDLANPNRAAARGYNYRLVELGFISNSDDVSTFNNNIDKIAKGILKCFNLENDNDGDKNESDNNDRNNNNSSSYSGNSIVDYLKSIGKSSDFASRKRYASEYGINNYSGTAEQNSRLLSMMRGSSNSESSNDYFEKFSSNSIVDGLKSIGEDSSFNNRQRIARANGISNYEGTASQNDKLCSLGRRGELIKP